MTRILTVDPQHPDADIMADAAHALVRGELVAFPTETVYGLGAHALNPVAIARMFAAKRRPATDPVIVHLARAAQLHEIALSVPSAAEDLARAFWPGALTLVLLKRPHIPDSLTAGLATVGVRVPSHPVAHRLIDRAGIPVAAPSANRFSRPSPTSAEHVRTDLDGVVDIIIDGGPTPIGVESTIIDLTVTPPVVRRPGGVSLAELKRLVPDVRSAHGVGEEHRPQLSPGQLLRHYAPRARLTLYVGPLPSLAHRIADDARSAVAAGARVGILAPEEDLLALAPRLAAVANTGRVVTGRYGARRDHAESARELFRALRALDAAGVDIIFAAAPAADDIGAAVVDRLTRAAEGRVIRLKE